jgi:hypothetical protein
MTRDVKLVLIYAIIVAGMTIGYATYQDLGLMNHAKATPAPPQVKADDE